MAKKFPSRRHAEVEAAEAASTVNCTCGWLDHPTAPGPVHAEDCEKEMAYIREYEIVMDKLEDLIRAEEQAKEDGQSRWAETGSTKKD